jgi:hypothetical protein
MTTTTLSTPPGLPQGANERGRLPAPPRDRRPAMAALALLLIVAGALASALVAYRSGDRVDVLVAAHDIAIGEQVDAADFRVARVAADGAAMISASSARNFVGSYAATKIPQDSLLNRTMFLAANPAQPNTVVVGMVLTAAQRPASALAVGDVVRAYFVPKSSGGGNTGQHPGDVLVKAARVTEVNTSAGAGDTVSVSLLVADSQAAAIVPAAATGQVALARLPADARPAGSS